MDPSVLVLSAGDKDDRSAYTHRVLMLGRSLEERGFRCDYFYTPNNPPLHKETTASLFMPFWLKRLRSYDCIYCGAQEAGQALFFCKPFLRSPVVLDVHGDVIAQSALARHIESLGRVTRPSPRVRFIDRLSMRSADHFLTVSTYQRETFVQEGIPAERISLIRNGVDLNLFRQLEQPSAPRFTFAYVGEFQTWQGIDNLIESFRRADDPAITLLVVGFRESDAEVKRRFRDALGSRVELVDRVDRTTMTELLTTVSILIIPRSEHQAIRHAFPTKFAEYAAMGRPVMVNRVDETADFVTRYQCGFVSEPTPEVMARTIRRAARVDHSTLTEMGARARSMAEENFSWPLIGDEYAKLVRKLIVGNREITSS